jgi:hypothetical protein
MSKLFERSKETTRLINYLQALEKGASVTYQELSQIAGVMIKSSSPKLIYARKVLEEYHNSVWVPVRPRVGLIRLTSIEIAERQQRVWLKGARNKLSRGGSEAEVVQINELNIDQQSRFAVDGIQRQLAADALSRATRARLNKVARGNSNDLPRFDAIEWAMTLSKRT